MAGHELSVMLQVCIHVGKWFELGALVNCCHLFAQFRCGCSVTVDIHLFGSREVFKGLLFIGVCFHMQRHEFEWVEGLEGDVYLLKDVDMVPRKHWV